MIKAFISKKSLLIKLNSLVHQGIISPIKYIPTHIDLFLEFQKNLSMLLILASYVFTLFIQLS